MENNENLHAHVETYARDCDGGHGNEYTMGMNDDERGERESAGGINDFSDIHFMNRVMTGLAGPYAVEYKMTVNVGPEGFCVREETDEGYREANVTWCRDEGCDPNAQGPVYDEYAEAMGY